MTDRDHYRLRGTAAAALMSLLLVGQLHAQEARSHGDLVTFFQEWRAFERPPIRDGAPDYTAQTFAERHEAFKPMRARLDTFEIDGWSIPQQVDWHLIRAEMNGFDFNHRVLQPWARDVVQE